MPERSICPHCSLPLTRPPLASSVKNCRPWPPHHRATAPALCPRAAPAHAVLGCPGGLTLLLRLLPGGLGAKGFSHLTFPPQPHLVSRHSELASPNWSSPSQIHLWRERGPTALDLDGPLWLENSGDGASADIP